MCENRPREKTSEVLFFRPWCPATNLNGRQSCFMQPLAFEGVVLAAS